MLRLWPGSDTLPPPPAEPVAPPQFDQPAPPPPRRRRRIGRYISWALAIAFLIFFVTVGWLAVTAPLSKSLEPIAPPAITLTSADGRIIGRRGAVVDRPVDVRKLPPHVGQAFIAIEDRRFYSHWGIDPHGIIRAAWHNLRAGGVREGGSTITQQLAKLVFLNADRTAARKLREVIVAFWLEAWLSKDQILSRYLSNVYFGDNVYGLRAASRHYFSKPPEKLSVGEAALLAGMMKAPSRLAPSTNLGGAQARQAVVVGAMAEAGFLDPGKARAIPPARLHLHAVPADIGGSWFADWVLAAAREKAGGGYEAQTVKTTLDSRLQRAAERAIALAGPDSTEVALVAMKPDGQVVAMIGGRKYADVGFNRATQARRQPGSTFKLFVYLAALRSGLTPDDHVEDTPLTIDGWSPANSDRHYRGSITLREAFARSSNVAAARLAQKVGPAEVARAAHDLGIVSPLRNDASLALGTSGVTLLELTSAYAAVAGDAWPVAAHGLPLGEKGWLQLLWDRQHHFSGRQHDMLLDLLSSTVKSGTARGAALNTQVFGKTGTTQGNRDAIFVGFAGGLVTGVWVGRDDNTPLKGVAGGGLPAHIWRTFMAQAINATVPGRKPRGVIDPDALSLPASARAVIDNMSIDLGFDENGPSISLHPRARERELSPTPPEDGREAPEDEQ
jgi:penicillin-binding protein 1A